MEHEKFQNLQAVIEDANGKLLSLETEKISLVRLQKYFTSFGAKY